MAKSRNFFILFLLLVIALVITPTSAQESNSKVDVKKGDSLYVSSSEDIKIHHVPEIIFTSDGQSIIASSTGEVYKVNLKEKNIKGSILPPSENVYYVSVSNDGKYLVYLYLLPKSSLTLKNMNSDEQSLILNNYFVKDLTISSDGNFIAVLRADKQIVDILSYPKLEKWMTIEDIQNPNSICWSDDSSFLAISNSKPEITVVNIKEQKISHKFNPKSQVYIKGFSNDNKYIICYDAHSLYLFNPAEDSPTEHRIDSKIDHENLTTTSFVGVSADANFAFYIVTSYKMKDKVSEKWGSIEKKLNEYLQKIIELNYKIQELSEEMKALQLDDPKRSELPSKISDFQNKLRNASKEYYQILNNPDNQKIRTALSTEFNNKFFDVVKSTLEVRSVFTLTTEKKFEIEASDSFSFLPKLDIFSFYDSGKQELKFYKINNDSLQMLYKIKTQTVPVVYHSQFGKHNFMSISQNNEMHIYNTKDGKLIRHIKFENEKTNATPLMNGFESGDRILLSRFDENKNSYSIESYNINDDDSKRIISLEDIKTNRLFFDPMQRYYLKLNTEPHYLLSVFDVSSGKEVEKLEGQKIAFDSLSSLNDKIAAVNADNSITIYSVPYLKQIDTIATENETVLSVSWHPEDKFLAYSTEKGKLFIYDMTKKKYLHTIQADQQQIYSAIFTPDGASVVTGGMEKVIKFWNVSSGKKEKELHGQPYWITCMGISKDGKYLASGDESCDVKVWDLTENKEIKHFKHHHECWLTKAVWNNETVVFGCRPNSYTGFNQIVQRTTGKQLSQVRIEIPAITQSNMQPGITGLSYYDRRNQRSSAWGNLGTQTLQVETEIVQQSATPAGYALQYNIDLVDSGENFQMPQNYLLARNYVQEVGLLSGVDERIWNRGSNAQGFYRAGKGTSGEKYELQIWEVKK